MFQEKQKPYQRRFVIDRHAALWLLDCNMMEHKLKIDMDWCSCLCDHKLLQSWQRLSMTETGRRSQQPRRKKLKYVVNRRKNHWWSSACLKSHRMERKNNVSVCGSVCVCKHGFERDSILITVRCFLSKCSARLASVRWPVNNQNIEKKNRFV